jgi:hypothetical protein
MYRLHAHSDEIAQPAGVFFCPACRRWCRPHYVSDSNNLSPCSFGLISRISSHSTVFFSHNKPANSTFSTINQRNWTGCLLGLPPLSVSASFSFACSAALRMMWCHFFQKHFTKAFLDKYVLYMDIGRQTKGTTLSIGQIRTILPCSVKLKCLTVNLTTSLLFFNQPCMNYQWGVLELIVTKTRDNNEAQTILRASLDNS